MKKVIVGTVIAAALVAFSGCSSKSPCAAAKLPTCAAAPACGCAR